MSTARNPIMIKVFEVLSAGAVIGIEIHLDGDLVFKDVRAGAISWARLGKFPAWLNFDTGQIEQFEKRLVYQNEAEDDI